MTITDVRTLCLSRKHEPELIWFSSEFRVFKADCPIVIIETDGGLQGISEPSTYGDPPALKERAAELKYQLIGRDPEDPSLVPENTGDHLGDIYNAGIELALWDIRGKIAGKRVADLILDQLPMIQLVCGLESINPLWVEDPLPVLYMESWQSLKQVSRVPLNTGEKLEGPWEFFEFMRNKATDLLQPDLVFAAGYSGCWRIADMAEHFAIPVTLHNVGAVLQNAMSAQFAASTRNFLMTETNFGNWPVHEDLIEEKLEIRDGMLKVPDGPGIGVTPNEKAIKENRLPGEPYWD